MSESESLCALLDGWKRIRDNDRPCLIGRSGMITLKPQILSATNSWEAHHQPTNQFCEGARHDLVLIYEELNEPTKAKESHTEVASACVPTWK